LTWYEYDLYVQRFEKQQKSEHDKYESDWERTRQLWVALINPHSKKRYKPSDLIKLSYDDKPEEEKPEVKRLSDKEMKTMFGSKFKKDG
jgi:hypothetical protein